MEFFWCRKHKTPFFRFLHKLYVVPASYIIQARYKLFHTDAFVFVFVFGKSILRSILGVALLFVYHRESSKMYVCHQIFCQIAFHCSGQAHLFQSSWHSFDQQNFLRWCLSLCKSIVLFSSWSLSLFYRLNLFFLFSFHFFNLTPAPSS